MAAVGIVIVFTACLVSQEPEGGQDSKDASSVIVDSCEEHHLSGHSETGLEAVFPVACSQMALPILARWTESQEFSKGESFMISRYKCLTWDQFEKNHSKGRLSHEILEYSNSSMVMVFVPSLRFEMGHDS